MHLKRVLQCMMIANCFVLFSEVLLVVVVVVVVIVVIVVIDSIFTVNAERKQKQDKVETTTNNTPQQGHKMKILLLALTLGAFTQSVTAIEQEQQNLLRHDDHEILTLDNGDDEDVVYLDKTLMRSSSTTTGQRNQLKQSRFGARHLRPKNSTKYTKSAKSDRSSVAFPTDTDDVPTPAPIPVQGSPTSDPTREQGTTDSDYFVNFPTGFLCDPVPFFMERNVNPSTAFNGLYPQLINNGFNPNCTLRLLPNDPADVSASAMQSFSFKPGNTDMQFRMEVGTLFVVFIIFFSWH
jgi:hypothetical protein